MNYIQEYYTEDISLPLLAAHSGLSQKYFGRLFREQTGYTVREYLTGVRIRNAKHLLSHTDSSLEPVSYTHLNEYEHWVGPNAWRTTGAGFSYEYQLKRMGVLAAPRVFLVK